MTISALTVKHLVDGSKELNRKRDEVRIVVSAILGALSYTDLEFKEDKIEIEGGGNLQWVLTTSHDQMTAYLSLVGLTPSRLHKVRSLYSSAESTIKTPCVAETYQALQYLIDGMSQRFPQIKGLLCPYVEEALRVDVLRS